MSSKKGGRKRLTKGQLAYREKLRNPKWQKKRLEIMERDEWRCRWCETDEVNLQVHHGFYGRDMEPWDYPAQSLHTLCDDCHEDAEKMKGACQHLLGYVPPQYQHHVFDFMEDLVGRLARGEEMGALLPPKVRPKKS